MRALVAAGDGSIALKDVPDASAAGECRIRVRVAGICGTDLQLLQGYADFRGIPGHEFVGTVETAPPGDGAWIGKRVVGEINVGCGRCPWCASGVKEHCVDRTVIGIRGHDGAFAQYLTVPATNLHEIPDDVGDETAVFVEPVAAACRILEQIAIGEGSRVAVLGDGRMGLLTGQVVRSAGADVTIVGRHEHKLAIARALGLAAAPAAEHDLARGSFDVVVDATGRPAGLAQALEMARPRGTIVLKSTFHGEAPLASWPIVVNEVTIVGSRCGPFRRAIDMLTSGAVRVEPLISRITRLDEYPAAFAAARTELKVLFQVSS